MSARSGQSLATATISSRLKVERRRLGLTQTAWADVASVGRRAVVNWESGSTAVPDAASLAAFATVGADIRYIITGEREPIARLGSSVTPPNEPAHHVASIIGEALAILDPAARRQLLLDLVAREMAG